MSRCSGDAWKLDDGRKPYHTYSSHLRTCRRLPASSSSGRGRWASVLFIGFCAACLPSTFTPPPFVNFCHGFIQWQDFRSLPRFSGMSVSWCCGVHHSTSSLTVPPHHVQPAHHILLLAQPEFLSGSAPHSSISVQQG
jgi:hypothetical protein